MLAKARDTEQPKMVLALSLMVKAVAQVSMSKIVSSIDQWEARSSA